MITGAGDTHIDAQCWKQVGIILLERLRLNELLASDIAVFEAQAEARANHFAPLSAPLGIEAVDHVVVDEAVVVGCRPVIVVDMGFDKLVSGS